MEIAFEKKSLRSICENEAKAEADLGMEVAAMLKQRLADMRAATFAGELLSGSPRGVSGHPECMEVDLCDGVSVIFSANHNNKPKKVDWHQVSRIKIMEFKKPNG